MPPKIPKSMTLPNGKVISVQDVSSTQSSRMTDVLREAAARAGANAVKEAFAKNQPVTFGRNGKLIRLYPDGREEILGEYSKP